MTSFGKFWFRYIAPESDNPLDPSIDFSVTAEANLPDILRVFESFLKANGYDLDDRELSLSRKTPIFDRDIWGEDDTSLVGNPIPGGNSDDTLFFSEQYWRNRDFFGSYSNDVIVLGDK
jgi:hypothetical protein